MNYEVYKFEMERKRTREENESVYLKGNKKNMLRVLRENRIKNTKLINY